MKKIILLALLLVSIFGIWKYISIKSQSTSSADGQPSMIKDTKDTLEKTANHVPDTIERKKVMENNINDSVVKENQRMQQALDGIK